MTASDQTRAAAYSFLSSEWVERFGSIGFLAKGVLYAVIGAIAASVGFAGGAEGDASSQGAIAQLSEQSYGTVLLSLLAVGLAGYALLRLLHAFINPSGEDGMKGVVMRISYVVRFVIYGGLTFYAISEITGSGGGGGGSGSSQQLTGRLLELPGGRFLVAIIALVMFGVAISQLKDAWTRDFMDQLRQPTGTQKSVTRWAGVAGHVTRGLVFGTVGVLFGQAALQSDSSEAGGVDKAIQTLAGSGAGLPLLTLIGAGFFCYAVYCVAMARWGTMRTAG
ncbi:DUF1206 domain-containing protein [Euzebya tangerina]|uniref:DUF1206 domain-containing protein n=1 Tax=Euzebya tangerina TaxID=591198 RepID=UPI0013C35924|nr:DUF1206 domain-containing protein [Euzebya tangerina]